MSNEILNQLGEQFDPNIHARVKRINSEITFAPTRKQIDRLKHLEAKYLIRVKWDEVKTMVIASDKIHAIMKAIASGDVVLRTRPLVRELATGKVVSACGMEK